MEVYTTEDKVKEEDEDKRYLGRFLGIVTIGVEPCILAVRPDGGIAHVLLYDARILRNSPLAGD